MGLSSFNSRNLTMETDEAFNVEELRLSHESSTEWKLRRDFLLAHHDKFSHNRLLCLASCFVNVECYGCRYPGPVMVQLEELAAELSDEIQEHRNSIKQRNEVKFVKAGESSQSGSSGSAKKMTFVKATSDKKASLGGMNFVKASEEYKSIDRTREEEDLQLESESDRAMGFRSSANSKSKRKAMKRKLEPPSFDEFVILEPQERKHSHTAASILHTSAQFNHVPLEFAFRKKLGKNILLTTCQLKLCERIVAECDGESEKLAKAAACELALTRLKQTHYTLQRKKVADVDTSGITREELLGQMRSGAIPDSNIGNKLLKMMGWAGGGIGKKGQGIAEPVSAEGTVRREGLGLRAEKGISSDFLPKITEVVQEYIQSQRQTDLTFSPDFTKEERALIHRECMKQGLKTQSHGTGAERFLVVSRKRSANQLCGHIIDSGGETGKYVLVPPGGDTDSAE